MLPGVYFLTEDEQILVKSLSNTYVVNGPRAFFKPFLHQVLQRRCGISLAANEYCHTRNSLNGESKAYQGPSFFFLEAHEELIRHESALPLAVDEYIEVRDNHTGKKKVIRGETSYMLEPFEEYTSKRKKAVPVDEHTAVVIRNVRDGSLRMETEAQAFFPNEDEVISEVRDKVLVEDHEVVVLKDQDGKFHFRSGGQSSEQTSFFVPPYWEILNFSWSSGLHKDERNLHIDKFDLRPKFMWYEFDVRTRDNVELILKVTFFWQIEEVETLIRNTDDASGDVCSHARSRIIQQVSKVDFSDFLEQFNQLVREAILSQEDPFYSERGLKIHSVEVREIACKDQKTQDVLSEIIQETTTRINRIQKQQSENEVIMKRIEGELLAEEQEKNLLQMRLERYETESRADGMRQAQLIASFFEGLGKDLSTEQKLRLFEVLRKKELMEGIAGQNTRIFLTRDDVELKLDVQG